MNRQLYLKLAVSNVKKNKKSYIPYLLTCMVSIMMYYIMYAISINEGLNQMVGAEAIKLMLSMGKYVIAVFSVIFLFYTNSFLMKQRKKEIGLYNVLGLEKKHIAKILGFETVMTSLLSLFGGILGGLLMSRLMFLILLKLLQFEVTLQFAIETKAITAAVLLFAGIFIVTLIYNIFQIQIANPLELLRGGQTGEKEPKTKILLTVIGILSLGSGYGFALFTQKPMEALGSFFMAIILVMVGTYALFVAGSITLLKLLRKNKNFYYQTRHFPVVSGMIYRMKQNAVGLANICILSTAVLVTVSITVSLYVGMGGIIKDTFPHEFRVTQYLEKGEEREEVDKIIDEELEKQGVKAKDLIAYSSATVSAVKRGENFEIIDFGRGMEDSCEITMIPVSDYNKVEGTNIKLGEKEAMIFSDTKNYNQKEIQINDRNYHIIKEIDSWKVAEKKKTAVTPAYYLIVSEGNQIKDLLGQVYDEEEKEIYGQLTNMKYVAEFDTAGEVKEGQEAFGRMKERFEMLQDSVFTENREELKKGFYSLYGGFLFIGIFLGTLFLLAAVLIIYYKQISEGMEDRERFQIMQKVGMSKKEVRQSIRSQVLMVFFLPLGMAVLHVVFAFPIITKLLAMLNLTNISLFFVCTLITVLVFAIIYGVVFALTAREYYKIVEK